jgi:alginate O-acetyltransferase complex protein AlgI
VQFNSITFFIFLFIFFIAYWGLFKNSIKKQNILILVASLVFYGWWDYRFLSLILLSTIIDFIAGKKIEAAKNQSTKKLFLNLSLVFNLAFLGFFKYFNFFIDSFSSLLIFFGFNVNISSLEIILPVGISFYTFQTMSYSIDVYNGKLKACNDFIVFGSYVTFFPQLVAGPIERATHLLPQFVQKRIFTYQNAVEGLRQVLWGLFKKMVVADNCAEYANIIFNSNQEYGGSTYFIGAILFSFQIYGDFSGYSDIAIGTSRMFGFNLMQNFKLPYFSSNIDEFWKRWHISLSTWFRDYVYIPLGGNRVSFFKRIRNVMIVFLLSGLWHGANWTYIFWGFFHALLFLPLLIMKKNEIGLSKLTFKNHILTNGMTIFNIVSTYLLVTLCWVFFRSENITQAFHIFSEIFSTSLISIPTIRPSLPIASIVLLVFVEWLNREKVYPMEKFETSTPLFIRYLTYLTIMVLLILFYGANHQFIYFQF